MVQHSVSHVLYMLRPARVSFCCFCKPKSNEEKNKKKESPFTSPYDKPLAHGNSGFGKEQPTSKDGIASDLPFSKPNDSHGNESVYPLYKEEHHKKPGIAPFSLYDNKIGDPSAISSLLFQSPESSEILFMRQPSKCTDILDDQVTQQSTARTDLSKGRKEPTVPQHEVEDSLSYDWLSESSNNLDDTGQWHESFLELFPLPMSEATNKDSFPVSLRSSPVWDSESELVTSCPSFNDYPTEEERFIAGDNSTGFQLPVKVTQSLDYSSSACQMAPSTADVVDLPMAKILSSSSHNQPVLSSIVSNKIAQLQQHSSTPQTVDDEVHLLAPISDCKGGNLLHTMPSRRPGPTVAASHSFTPQLVPPLPLPPALVSAAILQARQKPSSNEFIPSVPVRTVAAKFSDQDISSQQPSALSSSPSLDIEMKLAPDAVKTSYDQESAPPAKSDVAPDIGETPSPAPLENTKGPPIPPPLPKLKGGPPPPPPPPGPGPPPLKAVKGEAQNVAKLKPLHWDKVLADSSHSMVWDRLKTGSFHVDEDEIRTLFGYNAPANLKLKASLPPKPKGFLDQKRAHHIAIQLRALKVSTQEIRDALIEGDGLNAELLDILIKMTPTKEEQKGLLEYGGDKSELGPADRFMKTLLEIPNAFQRLEAMRYRACFKDELTEVDESLQTLEEACIQMKESRLLLKLLEAVLKMGNLMNKGTNRGEALAFKVDTLLKLTDVKSADNRTTLLHFVVEGIIKAEGLRAFHASNMEVEPLEAGVTNILAQMNDDELKKKGLEVVLELCSELNIVKEAAGIDMDALNQSVSRLVNGLSAIQEKLKKYFEVDDSFTAIFEKFCLEAEGSVKRCKEEFNRVLDKVKHVTAYFHGNVRETQPLRLFIIVRDFLNILEKVCEDLDKRLKMKIRGRG